MQILQRERSHFEFRTQQEVMIKQLADDKQELLAQQKKLTETLTAAKGVFGRLSLMSSTGPLYGIPHHRTTPNRR